MIPDEVRQLLRATVRSIWILEILLLLRRHAGESWPPQKIVKELRSSASAASTGLAILEASGLVVEDDDGGYRFQPASPALDAVVAKLEQTYADYPFAVVTEIANAASSGIQSFADAFKLRKE